MKTVGIMRYIYSVDSVEALSHEDCERLEIGDTVIKDENGSKHAYLVTYRKDDEMSLCYFDHQNVEEVYYEKNESGVWAFVVKDITHIAQ